MWIIFAFGSAFFAGITAILAKCGIRSSDSTAATAVRTIVVLAFSWLMAIITYSSGAIESISARTWVFLVLSGLATGASWLCYFHALRNGSISKVVPIDKSSTVLTMLLAMVFLGEGITAYGIVAMILIGLGTLKRSWLVFAILSALFASLTSILGKIGIEGVDPNLGTAIRTSVVLVMAWAVLFLTGKGGKVMEIPHNELVFIILSGFATGASWLCYYRALQEGPASAVVPIDKLSILVSILFSRIVFHERLSSRSLAGLMMIISGTMLIVFS